MPLKVGVMKVRAAQEAGAILQIPAGTGYGGGIGDSTVEYGLFFFFLNLLPHLSLNNLIRGWVAQLVERPALDFGSGPDLMVHGIEHNVHPCA